MVPDAGHFAETRATAGSRGRRGWARPPAARHHRPVARPARPSTLRPPRARRVGPGEQGAGRSAPCSSPLSPARASTCRPRRTPPGTERSRRPDGVIECRRRVDVRAEHRLPPSVAAQRQPGERVHDSSGCWAKTRRWPAEPACRPRRSIPRSPGWRPGRDSRSPSMAYSGGRGSQVLDAGGPAAAVVQRDPAVVVRWRSHAGKRSRAAAGPVVTSRNSASRSSRSRSASAGSHPAWRWAPRSMTECAGALGGWPSNQHWARSSNR